MFLHFFKILPQLNLLDFIAYVDLLEDRLQCFLFRCSCVISGTFSHSLQQLLMAASTKCHFLLLFADALLSVPFIWHCGVHGCAFLNSRGLVKVEKVGLVIFKIPFRRDVRVK